MSAAISYYPYKSLAVLISRAEYEACYYPCKVFKSLAVLISRAESEASGTEARSRSHQGSKLEKNNLKREPHKKMKVESLEKNMIWELVS